MFVWRKNAESEKREKERVRREKERERVWGKKPGLHVYCTGFF